MSTKFDEKTSNGVVFIVFTRSMHGQTDGTTHGRTDGRTEPQQRYYIPTATRCAGITNCMLLGTNQRLANLSKTTLDLKVNDIALDNVKNQKLLGVEIDSHLDYNVHLDKLCKNISSKLALLKRINRYLNLDYRKLFYNGYVLPLINYCIVVWSNTSKTNLLRIHKLQKYAARIILDAAPDAPSKPLFDELNWLNIFEKINYQKSILSYKIKHEPSPSYLHQLFPTTYSTSRVLRSNTQDNLLLLYGNSLL